jgi:hypothetical protein
LPTTPGPKRHAPKTARPGDQPIEDRKQAHHLQERSLAPKDKGPNVKTEKSILKGRGFVKIAEQENYADEEVQKMQRSEEEDLDAESRAELL